MKYRTLGFLVLVLVLAVGALPLQAQEQVKYVGSSTVGKFMHEAASVYTDAGFDIDTKPESSGGEDATVRGMTDLGGVAREVRPEILEKGARAVLIGKDAIGVWINGDNPVTDLSKEQLAGIFGGLIVNWNEVGGADAPINIYLTNKRSATHKVFRSVVLAGGKYGGASLAVKPDPAVIDRVADDPHGIGQLSFALGNGHPREDAVRKIAVDGQAPTVRNSDYAITRPLYLITRGTPSAPVQAFLDWAVSPKGQAVVMKHFVGIGPAPGI